MLRTLLTPRWLVALVLALLFAVVTVMLGNWQHSRHEEKVERRERIEAHYHATPVPLEDVLTGAPLERSEDWTRVQVSGSYVPEDQLFVRNRPLQRTYGYEIVVPLETSVGTLAVDRGWAPNAEDATTLPEVPSAPEGEVQVVGWLRPGEADLGRDLPQGQLASINLGDAATAWGRPVLGAYLILETEAYADRPGTQIARPVALEAPDTGLGAHFAYSLQWWLTAPVGLILVLVMARREWRESSGEADAAPAPKPKKLRIWDEEDE